MQIEKALLEILPALRIRTKYIDLVSFASDAGFYHLTPKAVVQPVSEQEVISLFQFSHQHAIPLVFRTGGTSLSGQAITDGILVDLSQYWSDIKVEDKGNRVRVQPGITGAMVNAHLKKYHRKIGPDPSSINAAMMGGILSNNSSGMCCGVVLNSYHTTKYIRFILPTGQTFSTEVEADYERFAAECPQLYTTLANIRSGIFKNESLYNKIRHKYLTKNTVGYSINACIDYEHPLDIMAHLLIGAEGTLAFIAEAVMDTVPDFAFKSTALLYFPNIYAACQAIVPLTKAGALMVELMDRASLHAVENMEGMPVVVKTLPPAAAALLIEFQEDDQQQLRDRVNSFLASTSELDLLNAPVFTYDAVEQAFLWKVRKGLFPAVGAVRASGTTVILEDVAFPVEKLGDAITDLQHLFIQYEYTNAIIFGHAKDGNIHFVVTQSFNTPAEIERYSQFINQVIELVVKKYDGALKAEHGTGRNMAPFVQTEWGGEAYEIMQQIKLAADPRQLLNPGVIINADKDCHLKNLKKLPTVEQEVDRCIECGYCEHRCPSRDITTTPRRRIVVRRALQMLKLNGDKEHHDLLVQQYQYEGIDTCAVDGLCATACPVDINTGDLVKRLRNEQHSPFNNKLALLVAKNFKTLEWMARLALKAGTAINKIFGSQTMFIITRGAKHIIPEFPLWSNQITSPPGLRMLKAKANGDNYSHQGSVVYFASCITRMMGTYAGRQKNLVETFFSVCNKAGINVIVPKEINGSCCSQIFSSKGYADAYAFTANQIVENLWLTSNKGQVPIVTDVSSCAYTLLKLRPVLTSENMSHYDQLTILDSIDFLHDMVLPNSTPIKKLDEVVLHPVCSLEKLKTETKFLSVAQHFSNIVKVPLHAGCCGMAGDRGFLFPELTASATKHEANDVKQLSASGYFSSTKTCEMAMSRAAEKNYESILYLADDCL